MALSKAERPLLSIPPVAPARMHLADAAHAVAASIAVVTLVGWIWGRPLLASWGPSFVPMKPITALAVLALAAALTRRLPLSQGARGGLCGLAVLLGLSSLLQDLAGIDLRLEAWLAPDRAEQWPDSAPFRMAPAVALAIILAALAAAMISRPRLMILARILVAAAGLTAGAALVGYLIDIHLLYGLRPFNSVSLPTAVALLALCVALSMHMGVVPSGREWHGYHDLLWATVLVPLVLLAAVGAWMWRGIEADAAERVERIVAAAEGHARRVLEVQEALLGAALAHVRGRSWDEIASSPAAHVFLADMEARAQSSRGMLLVRPDTGRVIASSRHSPPPDVDISGRDYMRAEPSGPSGVMVGEVIRPTSSGTLGFTVGRRDPFSGLLAVSLISVEDFASFYAPQRAAPQDLLVLMREDGVILAGDVGGPYAVGLRSPELAASVVGKARRPMQVLHSQLDGVPRLLDGRRVGDYPVFVAYGLPASVLHAAWLRQTGPVALWALLSSGLLLYLVFRAQRAAQGTRQAEVAAQAARLRAVNAEALASNEERLRIALEGARLGLFERDLRSGIGHWDERTRDLLAVGREWRSNSRTDWLGRIHPEDRARVQAAFAAAAKGERIFDPEYRVLLAGGGVRWIGSRAEVQRSPEGEPTRLVGVVFDITERKDAEEKLRDSEATFRAMFAISSVGKAHADVRSGRFLRVNAALCSITGYSEQELLQCSLLDIVHPAERASEAQGLARLTNNAAPAHDVETRYLHKGGGIVWVHVTANVIPDRSGRPSRLTAIIQDITERKRAEEELRSATRQLDLAQQAGKVAAWEYVPGIDTAVWSQAMCELLGLDPARPPSLKMFREHVHPDDRDRLDRARAAEAAAPHGTESTIELRLLPSGGGTIWAERRSRVVIEKGERRVVGANIDLTARKRAEDHKTLLLNELNHRVKNTLATVQSIAMQTFRGGELNAQQVQAFQGRLLALAAAHDVLTRESWEGADLHDVVSQAVAPHRGEDAARIRIEGPSVRLQPKPALAVAMGLHELCTNAAKYGALSQTGGCVSISWTLANGSGPPRLRLQWRESGGPAVKRPRRPGFGSRLIGTLLAEDLDAEIALDYPPTGCVCTIDAPLSTPAGEQGKA